MKSACVRANVLVVVSACISNEKASLTVTANSTPNKKSMSKKEVHRTKEKKNKNIS